MKRDSALHAFVCGHPALDFAATLRSRRSRRSDLLVSPDRLDAWYRGSGLADTVSPSTPADLVRARAVREAVYDLVTARRLGEEFDARALALVNEAALGLPAPVRLTPEGRRIEATAQQALSTVARRAVELLGGPDAALLKECGNPECTRVYLDRSHGMRRQWCGMESCGNRMKAAAYRARHRGEVARAAA